AGSGGPHGHGGGGGHTGRIEGVDNAAELRDLIMDRVRRSRSAGLGDEAHHDGHDAAGGRGAMGAEHLAVLRAIRDDLRAARSA
ncbi:MAG TPA: hypothetical protein VG797_01985, partial [Phycisphaerales bacterium]|nr:hypothetical protein [Phycisphaerales bacterium]